MPGAIAERFQVKRTAGLHLGLPILTRWLVEASSVLVEDLRGQRLEICEQPT